MKLWRLGAVLALSAAPVAGQQAHEGTLRRPKAALPPSWRSAIGSGAPVVVVPALEARPAAGAAPGDALGISLDDDFPLVPFSHEGRLAVSPGAAGPSDFLAIRFATQDFARELPVSVTGARIGFDNRYGRTTWPLIALRGEDPLAPLRPAPALLAQVTGFTPALAAPAVPPGPDVFLRAAVAFAPAVTVGAALTVDDGLWSDAFDRPIDELLDNPGSQWRECDLLGCPAATKRLTVRSLQVVKSSAGDSIALKTPDPAVWDLRPVEDRDLLLSADYDMAAAGDRVGIVFRFEALDRFYLAEYRKSSNEMILQAMTPGGLVQLLPPFSPATPVPVGTLRVDVRGVHPLTRIDFTVGTGQIVYNDPTYGYSGVYSGIASLGASLGEKLDNFRVLRNPDVFVVLQVPPGEDAALPAEWSRASAGFSAVLGSADGTNWTPLAAGAGCVKRPNTFVQLQVAHDFNLFQVESKLVEVAMSCPTCAQTREACWSDTGSLDRNLPVFETGKAIDINAGWWNEHAPDVGFLRYEFQVWSGLCSDPNGTLLQFQDVVVPADPGQRSSGGPAFRRLAAPGISFTPATADDHCAVVIELYDRNGDGCFDGWEGTPCPIACTCVADPDENMTTGVVSRDFKVVGPCTPLVTSEIVRTSLRAARDLADPAQTFLSWSKTGGLVRQFNVQMTALKAEVADPAIRDTAATFDRVLGGVPTSSVTEPLPTVPGGVVYFAVFQNDGCASGWSLADP